MHFFFDAQNKPSVALYDGVAYAYMYNLQGDVIALVNASGTKVVEYRYDAWGKPISKTGSMASTLGTLNPFRYRGYVYDEETELYYLINRFYSPKLCRFLNGDAFFGKISRLFSYNLWVYCGNNCVNKADPVGNESLWIAKRIAQPALANGVKNLAFITRLKHIGGNSYRALRTIEDNDESIKKAAQQHQIPVALIQSVLFREQICLGIEDPIADIVFSIFGKYTTSTGLAQIKPSTAIRAEKAVLGESSHTMESMFNALHDDETNIMYAAMVLKMEALALGYDTTVMTREQMIDVLTRYNGDRSYGEATIEYYDAFAYCLEDE